MNVDHNPYLAPAPETSAKARTVPPHAVAKWVYLACLCSPFLFVLVSLASGHNGLVGALTMLAIIGAAVAYLYWLHQTWMTLPSEERGGRSGVYTVLLLFLPFYQYYWAFAVNKRIEAHLGERLARYPTRMKSPSVLAWLLPAFSVVAILVPVFLRMTMLLPFMLGAPILCFVWMYRVDDCFRELAYQRKQRRARKAK